jgi:hypothetical protein
VKSKSSAAPTIGEMVILLVVIIVFIALLPPAISLVRKHGGRVALKHLAGIGATPMPTDQLIPQFLTTTRSVSLGGEEVPPGTRLKFVSIDGLSVRVLRGAGEYAIPIWATDLQ